MNSIDSSLFYRLGADLIVVIHFSYAMFVLMGQFLITIGGFRNWKWVRNLKFRVIHLAAILFVVFESMVKIKCPLTTLEKWLKGQAGDASYQGDFIAACIHETLFMELSPWIYTVSYYLFGLLVLITFYLVPPRRNLGQKIPKEA